MNTWQRAILIGYGLIVAAWPLRVAVVLWLERRFHRLGPDSPRWQGDGPPPSVTAIVPAKDEESTLGDCLTTLAAQSYPDLDILVVDDRSDDRTGAIAREFAAAAPRARAIAIDRLPHGWTGKTHALSVAAPQARGEWLWFVDADTRHDPHSLAVLMEYARSHGAAMASLLPELRCETFWEKLVQPLAGIVLMRSFPLFRVNDDRAKEAFANGQDILIRRDAYEAAGGHEAVRDRFVEDIYLARRVKAAGFPIRVAVAPGLCSTRMYTSLPGLVRGWSRILYDALGRRPLPLVGKIVEPLVFSQTGDLAVLVAPILLLAGVDGEFAGWLLGLGLVHQVFKQGVLYRMYAWTAPATARYALLYPLAGIVSAWIVLKSIAMCRTGRVEWRGTAYGPGAQATK